MKISNYSEFKEKIRTFNSAPPSAYSTSFFGTRRVTVVSRAGEITVDLTSVFSDYVSNHSDDQSIKRSLDRIWIQSNEACGFHLLRWLIDLIYGWPTHFASARPALPRLSKSARQFLGHFEKAFRGRPALKDLVIKNMTLWLTEHEGERALDQAAFDQRLKERVCLLSNEAVIRAATGLALGSVFSGFDEGIDPSERMFTDDLILNETFFEKRGKNPTQETHVFFHSTSEENAARIQREGFHPGRGGAAGPAIYLAIKREETERYGTHTFEVQVSLSKSEALWCRQRDYVDSSLYDELCNLYQIPWRQHDIASVHEAFRNFLARNGIKAFIYPTVLPGEFQGEIEYHRYTALYDPSCIQRVTLLEAGDRAGVA